MTKELQIKKILHENHYNNLKIKMSAINDVITAITQRMADLKRQFDYEKRI